jgi:hypothetical protein
MQYRVGGVHSTGLTVARGVRRCPHDHTYLSWISQESIHEFEHIQPCAQTDKVPGAGGSKWLVCFCSRCNRVVKALTKDQCMK